MQGTVQEIQTTPPIQNTPFIARSSTATPNPFLDDCQILNRPKTPLFNGNHTPQQPLMKPTVLSPKAVPVRPSLPPVPPRSRPTTPLTPIRIPVDLVRRRQKTVEERRTVTVPIPVQERNGGEAKKIPSPEKIESKSNGNCSYEEIKQINQNPCPCKSGAHPKIPVNLPVNGFISKQPVRGKEISFKHFVMNFFVKYLDKFCFGQRIVANTNERWRKSGHTNTCAERRSNLCSIQRMVPAFLWIPI